MRARELSQRPGVPLSSLSLDGKGERGGTLGGTAKRPVSRVSLKPERRAIDVQDLLVWTYRHHCADRAELGGAVVSSAGEVSMTGIVCGMMARGECDPLPLGVIVVEPDARAVHATLVALVREGAISESVRRFVVDQAYQGEEPTLAEHVRGCYFPIYAEPHGARRTLAPKIEWLDKKRRYGFCPVRYEDGTAFRDHARNVYSIWHEALTLLGGRLRQDGRLERWLVHGPGAPARPWETLHVGS